MAKYKNLTKAANALLLNQPNVSRAVKNLEKNLNTSLFVRSNRGVTLTPNGEKLYAHISLAFEQINAAEEEISKELVINGGIISIGASETALHALLLPVLSYFKRLYPNVKIKISNHSTPEALLALKNDTVDFAVVTTPTGAKPPLKEEQIFSFKEILVGGNHFKYLKDKTLTLSDLKNLPLITLGKETKTFEFYSKFFKSYGENLEPDMEAATADLVLPMVKADLGVGFIPEIFAEKELKNKEIFKLNLKESIPKRHICIIYKNPLLQNLATKSLIKMLKEQKISHNY